MRRFINWAVIIILTSCRTVSLPGTYRSNCAEIGFFLTTVKINGASTFEYQFRGDLINEFGTGSYYVSGGIIELNFTKDTTQALEYMTWVDSIGNLDTVALNFSELLHPTPTGPIRYKIGNNKLWVINMEGDVVKRAECINRTRRFLIRGGNHMTTRRYYLIKTE